jgi:hypothetical protein
MLNKLRDFGLSSISSQAAFVFGDGIYGSDSNSFRASAGGREQRIEGKAELARPERFELPTYCSGGNRSIQLSYGRPSR